MTLLGVIPLLFALKMDENGARFRLTDVMSQNNSHRNVPRRKVKMGRGEGGAAGTLPIAFGIPPAP